MWKAKQSCKISTVKDQILEEENRKHETSGNTKINDRPAKERLRQEIFPAEERRVCGSDTSSYTSEEDFPSKNEAKLLPTLGKRRKRTGRAFQLCRQHHTACHMES